MVAFAHLKRPVDLNQLQSPTTCSPQTHPSAPFRGKEEMVRYIVCCIDSSTAKSTEFPDFVRSAIDSIVNDLKEEPGKLTSRRVTNFVRLMSTESCRETMYRYVDSSLPLNLSCVILGSQLALLSGLCACHSSERRSPSNTLTRFIAQAPPLLLSAGASLPH